MATNSSTTTSSLVDLKPAQRTTGNITTQLSVFDLIPPRVYIKFIVYLPLQPKVSFKDAFKHLQTGLRGTLRQFPFLDGRIFPRNEHESGWKPGHIVVSYDPTGPDLTDSTDAPPRQLAYKDVSETLPAFEDLRDAGFEFSAFDDELVLSAPFVPDLSGGADVFLAQANFVQGGCILATGFHHSASDATGMVTAMRAWAEHCRDQAQDNANICDWIAPESFNRTLLERLWGQTPAKPVSEIPRDTWGFLGFRPPDAEDGPEADAGPPPAPTRTMESSIFYISPDNFDKLKHEVLGNGGDGTGLSANDALLALFWRALMKARYRAAIAAGQTTPPEEVSYLESPVDGRPDFDPALPPSYAGNLVVVNKVPMPVAELAAPSTTLRDVALRIRAQAAKVNPGLVKDAFTLMREVPDYTKLKHAFTRLDGFDVMITSVLLLPLDKIDFGAEIFDNDGKPESLRPLMDAFNANFRLCMALPMKSHGGIELLVSLFADEMEQLLEDDEFAQFAAFCCH